MPGTSPATSEQGLRTQDAPVIRAASEARGAAPTLVQPAGAFRSRPSDRPVVEGSCRPIRPQRAMPGGAEGRDSAPTDNGWEIRMSTGETLVFLAVIGARFLVPLLIPRFPLPAIFACLVLDAADQSIFQAFGYDPPGYQGYDKAMDVYYLAMAYLSTLRNWSSVAAYRVGRFLYFYRLVGVVAFELTQVRALLLIFPNTFEYFFIAYEAIRVTVADRALGAALVDRRRRLHLGLHQAAAGVVDPRGPARLHRLPRRQRLGRADHRGPRCWSPPGRSGSGAARACCRPTTRGGSPRTRYRRRWRRRPSSRARTPRTALVWSIGDPREGGPPRPAVGHLRADAPGRQASNFQLFIGVAAVVVVNAAFTLALARRSRACSRPR